MGVAERVDGAPSGPELDELNDVIQDTQDAGESSD